VKNVLIGAVLLILLVPASQAQGEVSTDTLLTHNKHLLHGTIIGRNLRLSTKSRVQLLYKKANSLYVKAKIADKTGYSVQARNLASKSIAIFYVADEVHNLPMKYRKFKNSEEEDYVW